MKIISYKYQNNYGCGYVKKNIIHPLFNGDLESLNSFMINFIHSPSTSTAVMNEINVDDVQLIAPLPIPNSFRDAYAFRQHVEAGRKNRGLEMIPEYDEFPVFYFSNHNSITGPGEILTTRPKTPNVSKACSNSFALSFKISSDISSRISGGL